MKVNPKLGRRATGERRSEIVAVPVTPTQYAELILQARLAHAPSLAAFARERLLEALAGSRGAMEAARAGDGPALPAA